jgi:opacity protein-like surface antigen
VNIGTSKLTGDSNGSGPIYDAGSIKSTDKVDGESLLTVGRYPVTDRLTLFGEAGVFFWHSKEKLEDPISADNDDEHGNSFTYGGGFEYDIGIKDCFIWRVEVQQYKVDQNHYDATAGSTGLVYRY